MPQKPSQEEDQRELVPSVVPVDAAAFTINQASNTTTGAEMTQVLEHAEVTRNFLLEPTPLYIGRVEFGTGNIDASGVSKEEFGAQLDYIAREGLVFRPDFRQLFGGCMDGRGDIKTEAGTKVEHRPKVIGGPSLFAWYVASIGDFSLIEGIEDPLKQFEIVNKQLAASGFRLGMHRECGAARGVIPVLQKYGEQFDKVSEFMGRKAKQYAAHKNGVFSSSLREGVSHTFDQVGRSPQFNEDRMIDIIKSIDGDEAVIHLDVDHAHPTSGHNEEGLVFLRVKNAVIDKAKIIKVTGRQNFYQNVRYATNIVEVLAQTPQEYGKGVIIGDQLPLAGVATLGKRQHVGEIVGQLIAA